jgi:hypothetical protein
MEVGKSVASEVWTSIDSLVWFLDMSEEIAFPYSLRKEFEPNEEQINNLTGINLVGVGVLTIKKIT